MTNQNIAVGWDNLIPIATPEFTNASNPTDILSNIIPLLFPLAGVAMLIYLIYGGYIWMLSGGDPKKVAHAQGIITNAIIGFIIIFGSYWIVQLFGELLDIEAVREIF